MAYWKDVRAQAWAETLELMRLDNPGRIVMTVALLIVPTVLAWLALGAGASPLDPIARILGAIGTTAVLAACFYGIKCLSVPPRRELKLIEDHTSALATAHGERDAAAAALAEKSKPPARDPNSIYQFVGKVGEVVGAERRLNVGEVYFRMLRGNGQFNLRDEFDYQDLRLIVARHGSTSTVGGMGGVQQQNIADVVAVVRGSAIGA